MPREPLRPQPGEAPPVDALDEKPQFDIASLENDERRLSLNGFGADSSWFLGSRAVELALAASAAVTVDIRRSNQLLFHVALGGASPDLDEWIRRKSAVALRFEASSQLMRARFAQWDIEPGSIGWLDPQLYALSGGSVPIRVDGVGVVGAITVSGLTDEEDHGLAVRALELLIEDQAGRATKVGQS